MENESMNKWLAEWFDQNEEKIYELMKDLWAHPEVGLKEYHACEAAAKFARSRASPL